MDGFEWGVVYEHNGNDSSQLKFFLTFSCKERDAHNDHKQGLQILTGPACL